jgi:cupin fold WbuC family metalloprotein
VSGAPLKLVTDALLDGLAAKASVSPRRRAHRELHDGGGADLLQRFLVVAREDSYFQPHRHDTRAELCTMLRGRVEFVTFDDDGRITQRQLVGEGSGVTACEMPPRTWHTVIPRSDVCAFLEVKLGPYDPATAKEFAPWAPGEKDAAGAILAQWLRSAPVGALFGEGGSGDYEVGRSGRK